MLEGCGHLPYEEPGVSQLREAVERFLDGLAEKENEKCEFSAEHESYTKGAPS